ncbi:MAG TPA: hypothetical protein VMB72_07055 [Acidimicrobiales bacterium]|nr:hypothetical protein [Acidimicrobiales bacterium]
MRGRAPGRPRARWALGAGTALVVLAAACGGSPAPPRSAPAARVVTFGVVGNRGKIAALEHDRPTPVPGIAGTVVQIATSNSDGYALTAAGTVWAWGVGSSGELGDGAAPATARRAVEVALPAGVRIASLADPMPFDGALAVDTAGHAWGWGLDADGDLCLPGSVLLRPERLPLAQVTLAVGARTHALVEAAGTVEACGSGQGGALGTGSSASSATPVPVVGLPGGGAVVALTASWEGSGALLRDGTYDDWGYGPDGQLGDGATADSDVPVRVVLPGPVRQVFQGGSGATNGQTVAVLRDGSVWAWGDGRRGQLGDGSTVDAATPVRVEVPRGVTFRTVVSGGYSSYAIDGSGHLWAWGGNQNGQLGLGAGVRYATAPVAVGTRLTQVAATASNVAGLT